MRAKYLKQANFSYLLGILSTGYFSSWEDEIVVALHFIDSALK
ncbi:MAG: hypothetical protein ACI9C4_001906 [Paraglaciecola sp.]|jgi:hypothetical protein